MPLNRYKNRPLVCDNFDMLLFFKQHFLCFFSTVPVLQKTICSLLSAFAKCKVSTFV